MFFANARRTSQVVSAEGSRTFPGVLFGLAVLLVSITWSLSGWDCRTGGGRSLALTILRLNSLLTGKNTGNLRNFAVQNRTPAL